MIQRGITLRGVELAERGERLVVVVDEELRAPGRRMYDVAVVTDCELTQKDLADAVQSPHIISVSVSPPTKLL
jgi:hypothetical protein